MLKEQLKGMQQRKDQQRRCLRSKGQATNILHVPCAPLPESDAEGAAEGHAAAQGPEAENSFHSVAYFLPQKAMLKEQLKGMQQRKDQQRRCLRSKGRRHHKCARSNTSREEEGAQ